MFGVYIAATLNSKAESKPIIEATVVEPGASDILAPGYQELTFEAPAAGTYSLTPINVASDARVIDTAGEPLQLHSLLGDKYVLLSFIYSLCDDVNGCPLANYVFNSLQTTLADDQELGSQVRFVSVSFDPKNDSPSVINNVAKHWVKKDFDWQFLTTTSEQELAPLLTAYDQPVTRELDEAGNPGNRIAHILRVFLIDKDKEIRNIYSTSFLHAETVLNDIKTLMYEDQLIAKQSNSEVEQGRESSKHGAGDYKGGYETENYTTRAQSVLAREGDAANLVKLIRETPLGLPAYGEELIANISADKVSLGRELFFDRRLSHNNTFSCAMCHIPEQGFSSNELQTAVGIEGRTVRRNTPTLYNVGHAALLFHDARESKLEQQIWSPLLALNEMGNPSVGRVIDKVSSIAAYKKQIEQIYQSEPNMMIIGDALAAYERTLVSGNSKFDQWYYGKKADTLSENEVAGFELFNGKARCVACHTVGESYALFTDFKLHNTGVGYQHSMGKKPTIKKILISPGNWIEVDMNAVADASEPKANDLGYYEITEDPIDRWKYKTPSLRNILLTAPYMHDGSISDLKSVVEFYNQGGINNELRDPLITPLGLSDTEVSYIVDFLHALTGDNVDLLISDAFAAPVGNVK